MKTLLIEDDLRIADGLKRTLAEAGHAPDLAHCLSDAWLLLRTEAYDVVLLDLGLPDGDGQDVLRRLRNWPRNNVGAGTTPDVPVIIMTARDAPIDRIGGLDSGADDYLTKPFHSGELLARLRALQRRAHGRAQPTLRSGAIELDPAARTVWLDGQSLPLSAREFDILHTLIVASPRVLSKAQIESRLYPSGEEVESNAIEVHISHLRRKLGDKTIQTMRGVGYFIPQEKSR